MNIGQRLAALSGLSGVSALAHLLGITTGGTSGEPVFVLAERFFVAVEEGFTYVTVDKEPEFVAKVLSTEVTTSSTSPLSAAPTVDEHIFSAPDSAVLSTPVNNLYIVEMRA